MSDVSLKIVNTVKDRIVEFANEEGIVLSEMFPKMEDFKSFVFSFTFKILRDMGYSVQESYDLTLGEGQYEKLFQSVLAECENQVLKISSTKPIYIIDATNIET